jgi:hypothetical protein
MKSYATQPAQNIGAVKQVTLDPMQFQPMIGPNGELLIPVQYIPVETPTTASKPMAPVRPLPTSPMPNQVTMTQPPADEPIEVVAITHTAEPPLANEARRQEKTPPMAIKTASDAPRPLPAAIRDDLNIVPPGAQVLILQPAPDGVQPTDFKRNEQLPNVLTLPAVPEELKMITKSQRVTPNSVLLAAVKAYQDKSPAEANKQLADLDPVNQDLLRKLLPLAVRLGDSGMQSADPAEVAEVVEQLQQVLTTLRAKAALRIEKLAYCRPPAKPMRYGMVQPMPDDHAYHPGETVEVYMELRNFSCEAKDSEFATHLATVLEVKDELGQVVSRFEFERDKPDIGAAPKQNYFHICRFPVHGLTPGQYTLTARITDVPTGKTADKTLPLCVQAAKRTTARGTAD